MWKTARRTPLRWSIALKARTAWPKGPAAALERQQSLAQYRLATAAAQGGIGVMQTLSLASLATPLAPLFLPTLALPFPFFMLPPPKNPPPKP